MKFILELVQCFTQGAGIGIFKAYRKYFYAFHLANLFGCQIVTLRAGQFRFHPRQLSFQMLHVFEDLHDASGRFLRLRLDRIGHLLQLRFPFLDIGQGALARHCFHPADARRHAGFGYDLEKPDITGALYMGAPAQLARGSDFQHTHFIAIFLAEQHHRAGFFCLLYRHHARASVPHWQEFRH